MDISLNSGNSLNSQRAGALNSSGSRKENRLKADNNKKKTGVEDVVRGKWKKQRGAIAQASEIYETFGTDKVINTDALKVDLLKESGNNVLESGVINNIQLGRDTGLKNLESNQSQLVQNNDVLAAWEKNNASEKRKIVQDYSKSPEQRRNDGLNSAKKDGRLNLEA